jgi:hypothetical protein
MDDDFNVIKVSSSMRPSCCQVSEFTGEVYCSHPLPRPPWYRRLLWACCSCWYSSRMRVGSWIAGVDLDD